MKNVIGLRCHQWTETESRFYYQLLSHFSKEQIFVVVDEINNEVELPKYLNKVSLNKTFIERNGLLNYNHFGKSVGWLCGDYSYYALQESVVAEHYWLVEPDVGFTFDSLSDFFNTFDTVKDDALVCNFGKITESSDWFKPSKLIFDDVHTCLFPLNRLSYRAVEACKKERLRLSLYYKEHFSFSSWENKLNIAFPNDESLVVNTLLRDQFVVNDFKKYLPHSFEHLTYAHWFSIPQQENLLQKNQVIHPMRSVDKIIAHTASKMISTIENADILQRITINEDNIKLYSAGVANEIAKYIERYLTKKNTLTSYIIKLKDLARKYIPAEFIEKSRIWVWNNEIVVLECVKNGYTFILDIKVTEFGEVECVTFERYQKYSRWNEMMKENFNGAQIVGNRTLLFNDKIENDISLSEHLRKSVELFFITINKEIQ